MRWRTIVRFSLSLELSVKWRSFSIERFADRAEHVVRRHNPDLLLVAGEQPFLDSLIPSLLHARVAGRHRFGLSNQLSPLFIPDGVHETRVQLVRRDLVIEHVLYEALDLLPSCVRDPRDEFRSVLFRPRQRVRVLCVEGKPGLPVGRGQRSAVSTLQLLNEILGCGLTAFVADGCDQLLNLRLQILFT